MKIFVDFDDVLFNSGEFIKKELQVFLDNGVPEKLFRKYYYRGKGGCYDPKNQIAGIEKEISIDTKKLEKDVSKFVENANFFVFEDVIGFLKKFKKENLHMISFSETEFQKGKVYNSGITPFFESITITDKSKAEEIEKIGIDSTDNYFLDDRAKYIENVKTRFPEIKTILIQRPEGRHNDSKNKFCDHVAKNLDEALVIIK